MSKKQPTSQEPVPSPSAGPDAPEPAARAYPELIINLVNPLPGTMSPEGNLFFDAQQGSFFGRARVGEKIRGLIFSPLGSVLGHYDAQTGAFFADIELFSEENKTYISLSLKGQGTQRAPRADIDTPATAECLRNGPNVVLDARKSFDLDGDALTHFLWYDGQRLLGSGSELPVSLSLGTHDIRLFAFGGGGLGSAVKTIEVRDTLPPEIRVESEPPCLWPVNHKLVRYDLGRELALSVTDACDPAPSLALDSVRSSEPEDGNGDGHTSPDSFIGDGFVCVRAERSGGNPAGRDYIVAAVAQDASGNLGTAQTIIRTEHDQRPSNRCEPLPPEAFLEDTDARCAPLGVEPRPTQESSQLPEQGRGCSQAPGEAWGMLAFLLLGPRRRRWS